MDCHVHAGITLTLTHIGCVEVYHDVYHLQVYYGGRGRLGGVPVLNCPLEESCDSTVCFGCNVIMFIFVAPYSLIDC